MSRGEISHSRVHFNTIELYSYSEIHFKLHD